MASVILIVSLSLKMQKNAIEQLASRSRNWGSPKYSDREQEIWRIALALNDGRFHSLDKRLGEIYITFSERTKY